MASNRATDAIARLATRIAERNPVLGTVIYRRVNGGSTTDISGKVFYGRTVFVDRSPGTNRGPSLTFGERDFLFKATAITGQPERGDRIEITNGLVTEVYELVPFQSEPAWRWESGHKVMYRCHTKQIS